MNGYRLAILGATGMVGQEFIKVLEQRNFPVESIELLASDRSAGKKLFFSHREIEVKEAVPELFGGVDIALFSAGAEISRHFSPIAAQAGAVVIDNSSAFRMDVRVPLVVPDSWLWTAKCIGWLPLWKMRSHQLFVFHPMKTSLIF